ncbi:MAG: TonB family protein [Flavobacteriales bacterium]|nr:TonB family protein [Flavobacteriales bacterium]
MKHLRLVFLISTLIISFSAGAQMRSDFLDVRFNHIDTPGSTYYVREANRRTDGLWEVVVNYHFGGIKMKGVYSDETLDTEHGYFEYYYANGTLESCGNFDRGYKIGLWKRWDLDGQIKPDRYYPETAPESLVSQVIPAEFPGGDESLTMFLEENLVYPKEATKVGADGVVYVAFTIGIAGDISNAQVVEGVNYYLDNEALRLVSKMPNWRPARRNGNKVESSFVLPIAFDSEASAGK